MKPFLGLDETFPGATCTIASCVLHVAPCEERASVNFVATLEVLWYWGSPEPSPGRRDLTPSVFPHRAGCLTLWSSLWPSFGLSPVCPLELWELELDTVLQGQPDRCWVGWSHLVSLLVISLWIQPRIWSAFIAATVHCWLMFRLLSTRPPRSLSARRVPSHTDPSSWILSSQVQGFALGFVKLRTVLAILYF